METNINGERVAALHCLKIIQQYSWLLNFFVLDFFTEDHWGSLPASWRDVLSQISLEELGDWMSMTERTVHRVWPLSLLALRASAKAHSLPRKQRVLTEGEKMFQNEQNIRENIGLIAESSSVSSRKAGIETECLTHQHLSNLFVRHVKPKKRHETVVMAKLCAAAAIESGVGCIIDIGAGKGHLSRMLAYGYGLRMFCVEAQSNLIASAREIDQRTIYTASKYLGDVYIQSLPSLEYIEMMIGSNDDSLNQLLEKVRSHYGDNVSFGIVGLHPCGDLAATLLKLFASFREAKFICIASCCYMKLSEKKSDKFYGYPLSNFFQSLPNGLTHLTYEALEVSCHALEAYCQRLQKRDYQVLKIHCFRAVLEKLIMKHWPGMKHTGLRSVKHFDNMDFPSYAKKALEKVDIFIPHSDLNSTETALLLERWREVVILYSLRLLIAPLIETTIILDRLLFVHEKGSNCHVVPGFDPVLSPRNLILIGMRPQ